MTVGQFVGITPALLADPDFMISILPNLGLRLVFAGLGSYKLIRGIFRDVSDKMEISLEVL